MANRAVAERLAAALLGADPRFGFDSEGRWTLAVPPEVARAAGDFGSLRSSPHRLTDRVTAHRLLVL